MIKHQASRQFKGFIRFVINVITKFHSPGSRYLPSICVVFFQVKHSKTLISEAVATGEQELLLPEVQKRFDTPSASEQHLHTEKTPISL